MRNATGNPPAPASEWPGCDFAATCAPAGRNAPPDDVCPGTDGWRLHRQRLRPGGADVRMRSCVVCACSTHEPQVVDSYCGCALHLVQMQHSQIHREVPAFLPNRATHSIAPGCSQPRLARFRLPRLLCSSARQWLEHSHRRRASSLRPVPPGSVGGALAARSAGACAGVLAASGCAPRHNASAGLQVFRLRRRRALF